MDRLDQPLRRNLLVQKSVRMPWARRRVPSVSSISRREMTCAFYPVRAGINSISDVWIPGYCNFLLPAPSAVKVRDDISNEFASLIDFPR